MTDAEFNIETLVCTEHQRHGKSWIYKFKYFGNAHGIINIFVPACVSEVFVVYDEDVEKCKIDYSVVDPANKKFVVSDKLPIDLSDISARKLSIIAKSYAHTINIPVFTVVCEYLRNLYKTDGRISNSKIYSEYNKTKPQDIIGSRPRNIINSGIRGMDSPQVGSVPMSSLPLGQSPLNGSKNINDIIENIQSV